jgi:hypothetical protein
VAVSDLDDFGLLDRSSHGPVDRRKILKQLAAAGALVPLISSITVASAEAAVSCTNPCTDPSCSDYCETGCDPCRCFGGCACNPCSSPTCPGYNPCQCDGGQCNPACGTYDPCFCLGPCGAPRCGGQPCGTDCCLPGFTTCVGGICVPD